MKTKPFNLNSAKKYAIPGGVCYLYPDSPTGRLSCALVGQDGRYPEKGYRQNSTCTEALFVLEGSFTVTLNKKIHRLEKETILYIPPHTPYAVSGKGKVFVFIEPKWDSAQNTAV
ncbi:MAG: hypothetical protein HYZ63_03775 [Candidatus Andersenbacteria bacterium]|nr:hypothetical protein [Candidatus Andersenbacteria bacterium]